MDLLWAAFGAVAMTCLCAVAAGMLLIWHRVQQRYAYHRAAAIHKFPQRLHLRPMQPFTWRKAERAVQRADCFRALGFAELGGFTVEEIPGARLFAFQHPSSRLIGLVHEHEQLGTWSDVWLFAKDQKQPIAATSILKRAHFFLLPGSPKIHKRDAAESELVSAVREAAEPAQVPDALTASRFAAMYEEAFAEAIDQRLLEPLDENELRRLLREQCQPECCTKISDKEFARIQRHYPAAIANELRLVCAMQFLRETTMPASHWQEARDRILVVHDRTPLPDLARQLIFGAYLTPALRRGFRRLSKSKPPRETFALFNSGLPAWERYKRIGEVTRPVPADIYCAPKPNS